MNTINVFICFKRYMAILITPFLTLLPINSANALLIKHEITGPQFLIERDRITGVTTRETVTQPGTDRTTFEWTQTQKDTLTEITTIIIGIVDKLNPLQFIKGLFTSASDSTGDFNLAQVDLGDGVFVLELVPTAPIDLLGDYGLLAFSFDVDPSDFGKTGYVSYTAIGTTGTETILESVVPEPSTMFLIISFVLYLAHPTTKSRNTANA